MHGFHGRRDFVRGLGLGMLGLGLPDVLRMQARASDAGGKAKSCILIFLWGGPSHIDTFDMKPEAPAEYRGEFKPIATSVPGIEWCEHLPQTARMAHHVAVVRSLTQTGRGGLGDHHTDAYPEDIAATVYHALGIGRHELFFETADGRPVGLLERGEPLAIFG